MRAAGSARGIYSLAGSLLLLVIATPGLAQLQADLVVQQGQSWLRDVAFSPDGKQLLTAGDDTAILWDVETGNEIRAFYGHADWVIAAIFSPSGKEIATGSEDGTVRIWNVATGKEVRQMPAQDHESVLSMSYSPDGKTIAAGYLINHVREWDAATGRMVMTFDTAPMVAQKGGVQLLAAVTYSPNGKELLTATDRIAQVWDAHTGKELQRFVGHQYPIRCIAFSPDGTRVATGANDHFARLWNRATGQQLFQFDTTERANTNEVVSIAFSPDGHRVLTGTNHATTVAWDTTTGQKVMDFPKKKPVKQLEAPKGASQEEIVRLLMEDRERRFIDNIRNISNAPHSEIAGIAFSPDGKQVAIADGSKLSTKGVWIYDSQTGEEVRAFHGNAVEIAQHALSLAFSHDGSHMWTNGPVDWDLTTGVPNFLKQVGGDQNPIAISGDGSKIAIALDTSLFLFNLATSRELLEFKPNEGPSQQFRMFGETTNQPKYPMQKVTQLAFSPDDRKLVTTGGDFTSHEEVRVWDVSSGRETGRCAVPETKQGEAHTGSNAVVFSPDSKMLIQAGADKFIHVRNATTCADLVTRELRDVPARQGNPNDWNLIGYNFETRLEPLAMAFAPNGRQGLISTKDGIRLMDLASWRPVWKFPPGNGRPITQMVYSADGRRVVTSAMNRLVVLDASTGQEVFRTPDALPQVNGLAIAPEGKHLVSSHEDGTIRFWTMANDQLQLAATLTTSADNHWVVADPVGRFDTDLLDDNKLLHWVVSDEPERPLPLEMFMRQYYTPKLLPLLLSGAALPAVPNVAQVRRIQPEVQIVSATPSRSQPGRVDLLVRARRTADGQRQDSGLQDLRVFRNGQLVRYLEGPQKDGEFRIDGVRLPLGGTQVTFTAYAFSNALIKSTTASLDYNYQPAAKPTPRAFLLQIGENHYQATGCELQFSANDANRMSDVLAQKLKARGLSVVAQKLTSTDQHPGATKQEIRKALEEIAAKATPDDVFVMSFSGHGYTSPEGAFYILPSDIQGSCRQISPALLRGAISSDELASWLRPMDANEMTLILDSCYSAESVEANGFKPGPMGSRGLGQLAYDKRIRILTASQSDQTAGEDARLGQGILSYALSQEGLVEGKADWSPADGKILMAEWLNFAVHEVPQLDLSKVNKTGGAGRGSALIVESAPGAKPISTAGVTPRQVPAVFDFSKTQFVLNEGPVPAQPATVAQNNVTPPSAPPSVVPDNGAPYAQAPVSPMRIPRALPNAAPPVGSFGGESQDSQAIVLTHAKPMVQRSATITAPGNGLMEYNVFTIDTRDFPEGGLLDIELVIARNSQTDGSFDLFPGNAPIPTRGRPTGTLVGRYDVRRGTATRLQYRFAPGQVFALGLEGNWFSPRGATGNVVFNARVIGK
jgi:WD40 repeat protein